MTTVFEVVVNDEGQYSLWPKGRELPIGWATAGFEGSREDCLAHVKAVWTDMRPRSVRRFLENAGVKS